VLNEHPKFRSKSYRFLAAFFFEPPFAFFAIGVLLKVVVAQPPTADLTVTTGGLSHPPSYQM
jgi:hypothetical protein